MPRHTKTPGQLAPKNAQRNRKFSIVIHDVKPNSKQLLEQEINNLSPDWSLIAEEKYDHQDGSHIHLFLKYAQPKSKFTVLQYIQNLKLGQRVQVDIGRGEFEQCEKYLTNPDKIKSLDPNVSKNAKRLTLTEKYPEDTYTCPKCDRRHYIPKLEAPGAWWWSPIELLPKIICIHCWDAQQKKNILKLLNDKFAQAA